MEYPQQIHFTDYHTDDQHTCRSDHISKSADTASDHHRKAYLHNKEQDTDHNGYEIRIQEYLPVILRLLLIDHADAMGPYQYSLDNNIRRRIEYPLAAQYGRHQRDDQISRIRIYDRCLLYPVEMKRLLRQPDPGKHQDMNRDRRRDRQEQPSDLIRCQLNLKRVNDHTGRTDIDNHIRDDLTVLHRKQADLHDGITYCHREEHRRYLLYQ